MENLKEVYHLYSFLCEKRDDLSIFLRSKGIDAKIHYPTPLHLQPAASHLGYKRGDFPISERVSNQVLSLPVHEFISIEQLDFMVQSIKEFYDA
jgi:dTDP-4-amino-4,6-dideoxygalactose transaminase